MAKTKLCEICSTEFLAKTTAKVCSDECRKIYYQRASRRAYETSKTKYTCIKCGKDKFTDNVPEDKLCRHCRKSHYQFKNQITQQTLCKHCLKVLNSKTINLTRPDCEHIIWKVCDECKEVNKQLTSERMKLNNPSYFGKTYSEEEYITKKQSEALAIEERKLEKLRKKEYALFLRSSCEEAKKARDEIRKQRKEVKAKNPKKYINNSERMLIDNPMFKPEVRAKNAATRKAKMDSGELTYARGKDHHSWKGNNNYVRNVLRRSLRQWRIENLKRANYTCERCGKSHCQLHIHHKETFFDIVNKCAEELNIDIKSLNVVDSETNDYTKEFLLLETAVVDYHKHTPDLGIVVCLDCHDIIDPQFRKPHRKKIN